MASSRGGKGRGDDRWNRRPHHREQTTSAGYTGPRLAVLFAFVEPGDTLDFALVARRVLAARGVPGTPPTSGSYPPEGS